ncbi:DUF937 domain-containing protein [Streptomyces griseocarneus]|uniref:DUF937 domain-containing protein n=1 Tax=Streptomyces griseocarneus TaxID=51201 RepID=UPI00167F09E3|nr:DUF937 domain-containing protein [Streptomyces griseocarneus]MBZ6474350.1 DUF937 domain-containing protein [Streptomyces griseocarneus]GHG53464.1 hypothetical protein GCM10018779_15470 [Streptomyces griseocarneus]
MGDDALRDDVLEELGEDRIQELAGELGTDPDGARRVVAATVSALPADFGDRSGGGLMSGVLARISTPVAESVARQTGIPVATVGRALELLLPVIVTTLAKRRKG